MKKFAFTMIELVFVIVIIGIVTAMVIPRLDRDTLFEATNQTLNHIKYTQHLAMTQDVYSDTNANWFTHRWTIQLFGCGAYTVFSETNDNNLTDRFEAAIDPQTKKSLFVDTANPCATPANALDFEKVNMNDKYGIVGIATTGCNSLSFDTLGRPYNANTINGVLKQDCNITLTSGNGDTEIIRIHPETGYTCMLNAAGNCI